MPRGQSYVSEYVEMGLFEGACQGGGWENFPLEKLPLTCNVIPTRRLLW